MGNSPDEFGYLAAHLEYLCQNDPQNSSFLLKTKLTVATKSYKAPTLHDIPGDYGRQACCSGVLFIEKCIPTYN